MSAHRILLERAAELAVIDEHLDAAAGERGGVTVVSGPPGIGKTGLLSAARRRAGQRGFEVLWASGAELEQDFPFGIARQLYERLLGDEALFEGAAGLARPMLEATPDGHAAEPGYGLLHGLYWLTANLCERTPLLICVDDVHWADGPSLRLLEFLAVRVDDLGCMHLLGARDREQVSVPRPPDALLLDSRNRAVRPAPLSAGGARALLQTVLHADPGEAIARAAHEMTGGNPFFLTELAGEIALHDERDESLVRSLAPTRVQEQVQVRLSRLPAEAARAAHALAVLGDNVSAELIGALAALEPGALARASGGLVAAGLTTADTPLSLAHPLLRTALHEGMPPSERAALHRRAAELLLEAGAVDQAGAHLLVLPPAADPWVAGRLRESARHALTRGAPETAITMLDRAMFEPPPAGHRPEIHLDLGIAASRVGMQAGFGHLVEAFETSRDASVRVRAAAELLFVGSLSGRSAEAANLGLRALPLLDRVAPRLQESLLAGLLMMKIHSAQSRRLVSGRLAALEARTAGPDAPAPAVAAHCFERLVAGGTTALELARDAERALRDGLVEAVGADGPTAYMAVMCLSFADRHRAAEGWYATLVEDARRRGSATGLVAAHAIRAVSRERAGRLTGAEADAAASLELLSQTPGLEYMGCLASTALVRARLHRGDIDGALDAAGRFGPAAFEQGTVLLQPLQEARARVLLAQGHPEEALAVLEDIRVWADAWGAEAGMWAPWRTMTALTLSDLGDRSGAERIAVEAVALAQDFGAAHPLGVALRTLGIVRGPDGLAQLGEAALVLEGADSPVELAACQVALGAQLAECGRREEAVETLRSGLAAATDTGAHATSERAYSLLHALGRRPRRAAVSGLEALTATESRVAELAAQGLSNRQIAESLFVTVKTVEKQLSACYRKLGIDSRIQLPAAIGAD